MHGLALTHRDRLRSEPGGPINPAEWLAHVAACERCRRYLHEDGKTGWISGAFAPEFQRTGWYERLFTDGVFRHWWNGAQWLQSEDGAPHWRQVGDYPCWRGLDAAGLTYGAVA